MLHREAGGIVDLLQMQSHVGSKHSGTEVIGWYVPERFIHRPVPTDEGAGGEEQEPEDGKAKAYTVVHLHTKQRKAGDEVEDQRAS